MVSKKNTKRKEKPSLKAESRTSLFSRLQFTPVIIQQRHKNIKGDMKDPLLIYWKSHSNTVLSVKISCFLSQQTFNYLVLYYL